MSTFDFGDIEEADVWDNDPTIDPLQVALRLWRLRREFDLLAGRADLVEFDDLSKRERDDLLDVGVMIVEYVGTREPDNPARLAEFVHNHTTTATIWTDLPSDERQIGIDLMTAILFWLQREGPEVDGIYYVDAADWLRDAGLTVIEVKGWQTRARSSGGFAAKPLGIAWHHTASQTTPLNDTNWQYLYSDVAPIGNMTLMRNGDIWIGAAGCANTQGKGGPMVLSRGTIPADGGNTRAWAIEVANNGVGEPWPQVQIDAYFTASNELNFRFGNLPTDVFTHAFWTPGRKIDPAKASAVLGPWQPRPSTTSGTWDNDDVRAECLRRWVNITIPPKPKPPPTEEDDEMTSDQANQLDQVHSIMSGAFWPNRFNPPPGPNISDVQGGELATRIRNIETKLDKLIQKLG